MKKILTTLCITFLFYGCETDFESKSYTKEKINLNEIHLKEGRISFPNRSTFKVYYEMLKNKSENDLAEEFESKFYNNGFYSLVPIVSDENIEQLQRHYSKYKSNISEKNSNQQLRESDLLEHFDDLEEIFGEDVFQSFLNSNAELVVNDTIFKYTDKGLLFSKDENLDKLYELMENFNVKSLSDINNIDTSGEYPTFNIDGGLKLVNQYVSSYLRDRYYYLQPGENPDPNEIGVIAPIFYAGGGSIPGIPTINDPFVNFTNHVNNLEVCTPSQPWLANIFGTTKVCYKNFESAQRVKLKYYNVDFYLAYAVGVKVKHQHKPCCGIWRGQNTTAMALGINSITWYFNHSDVFQNTSYSSITNFYTPYDGKMYTSLNSFNNAFFNGSSAPLPSLPFVDDVDILIEVAGSEIYQTTVTEEQIRTFVYENLFNTASSLLANANRPMNKVGVIINQNGQSIVQYYDFQKTGINCKTIEKIFDWGFATPSVTYTFGSGNSNNSFAVNSFSFDFRNPSLTHLNVYGMAQRNGQWHGMRMVF